MKEIADIIRTTLTDRIRNRFPGAYLISWLLWNAKCIYRLFFGAEEIDQRIDNFQLGALGYIVPVLLAFLYLAMSPWLSHAVDLVQSHGIRARKKRRKEQKLTDLKDEIELEQRRSELEQDRLKTDILRNVREEVSDEVKKHLESIDMQDAIAVQVRSLLSRTPVDATTPREDDWKVVRDILQSSALDEPFKLKVVEDAVRVSSLIPDDPTLSESLQLFLALEGIYLRLDALDEFPVHVAEEARIALRDIALRMTKAKPSNWSLVGNNLLLATYDPEFMDRYISHAHGIAQSLSSVPSQRERARIVSAQTGLRRKNSGDTGLRYRRLLTEIVQAFEKRQTESTS
ncbi:MAG: hypothetical protein AAFV88_14025 [Planctomycetota bacterium]